MDKLIVFGFYQSCKKTRGVWDMYKCLGGGSVCGVGGSGWLAWARV